MFSCYECRIKDVCIYLKRNQMYYLNSFIYVYYCKDCFDKHYEPIKPDKLNNI